MTSTPETVDQSSPGRLAAARPPAIVAPKSPGLNSLTLPQQTALSFSTSTTPSPNNISISTYAKGTSPYYVTELMRFRHSCLLGLFWLLSFLGFVLLLVWSNEMQYDCFSFCDTPVTRSCSLLSSMNASDLSWVDAASSCFDAGFSAEWYSGGGFSTTMHVFGKDAIPTMSSPLRRHSRFVLRFITTDYTIVEDSLFSATNGPQVQSLVRVSEDGVVLMPAVTLDILPITNVFTLNFAAGSQNGAIIFELPTGYRFPEGTQQLALIFPGGPPLAPLYSIGDAGRGPVQLTFATSTPAYIIADTILRYVLIVANLGVVVLVFCLHALADTNVYPINDPTVPSGEAWFAWIRSVRCVMQREYPHVGGIWRRLPFFVKCTVLCLLTSTLLCDPLAAAFAGVPDNVFLKFWSLHLMPWWRFTWMVVTSAWLLACLITCGDMGRMFTIPRSVAAISDPIRSRFAAFIAGPSVWAFRSSLRWSTRALLLFMCVVPPALYLVSVISSQVHGWPSEPQSITVIPSNAMLCALIGMEMWFPSIILGFLYFYRRILYRRFPKGIEDSDSLQIFGVPSAPNNGRPLVIAVRFLLPYCVWTSVFVAGAHFGILTAIAALLPTYYNGYMVDVLQCMLLSWTIALVIVPVRKTLAEYPPKPSLYPPAATATVVGVTENRSIVHSSFAPPTAIEAPSTVAEEPEGSEIPHSRSGSSRNEVVTPTHQHDQQLDALHARDLHEFQYDPSLPLWSQVQWTADHFANIKTGYAPNCGYAFRTESHSMRFEELQRSFLFATKMTTTPPVDSSGSRSTAAGASFGAKPPPPPASRPASKKATDSGLLLARAIHSPHLHEHRPLPDIPGWRSFFCWETAVRALNMANESYNEVEGQRDLRHLLREEAYEQTSCEVCLVNKCCCCCFGGFGACCGDGASGAMDDDEDDMVRVSHLPTTTDADDPLATTERLQQTQHHQRHHQPDENDSGDDGEHASRLSATHRFAEPGLIAAASRLYRLRRRQNIRATNTFDSSINNPTWANSTTTAITTLDASTSVMTTSPSLGSQSVGNVRSANLGSVNLAATSSMGGTSVFGDEASMVVDGHDAASSPKPPPPPPSGDVDIIVVQTTSSADPTAAPPTSATNDPTAAAPVVLYQIDVTRYGYELVKVLEVFGVRVVIAATPPGTTGRHPHLCISFRGTVNLHNAIIDAKAGTIKHPEFPDGAEVHEGFCTAFLKILPSLTTALREYFFPELITSDGCVLTAASLVDQQDWSQGLTSVVCTGHSLGGALAMLCAYSIARGTLHREVFAKRSEAHHLPLPRIRSYTFGSPRLGNHVLTEEYNDAVPESYRITNENDMVPNFGMCWLDHAGREVRMNRGGDAVIEGTYLEEDYNLTAGVGSSIANHFLIRYARSMDNCLCDRNLKMLSPDCCSFLLVYLDTDAEKSKALATTSAALLDANNTSSLRSAPIITTASPSA